MPIQVTWGNPEKTILLETVEGEWTLADVYAMLKQANTMIASVPHTVDVIADLTNSQFTPNNLFSALNDAQRNQPYNTGLIIAVKANRYLKAIADVAMKLWPETAQHYRFVDTVEQAYQLIEENKLAN
jgi:hypothetical protein